MFLSQQLIPSILKIESITQPASHTLNSLQSSLFYTFKENQSKHLHKQREIYENQDAKDRETRGLVGVNMDVYLKW